jgi:hypothetical protein
MWRILLAAGAALLVVAVILAVTLHGSSNQAQTVTVTVTGRTTTTAPAPPTTTAPTTTNAPPPAVPMSWEHAGGLVVHAGDIDPAWLGQQMREAGFGWVAVYLGGPGDPPQADPSWIARFRAASGLPVGGWSVLGDDPAHDAAAAAAAIAQNDLAFYIADAEAPYGYTYGATVSGVRFGRSRAFVAAFRKAEPSLPAGVSSYCRPDQHDLDWSAWAAGGFVFLPQAYVTDLGANGDPATCATAAAKWFPKSQVHPTVASYAGARGLVAPARYAQLLVQAGTTGFSVYPAEVGMSDRDWQTYGRAIAASHIAQSAR